MKKRIAKIFAALLAAVSIFSLVACGGGNDGGDNKINAKIYAPDGAPALAMAKMMSEDRTDTTFEVVKADTIASFVTGDTPKADLCVLPLNAASKLLGTGEKYTMLGTVTHGNLYLLSHNALDAELFTEGSSLQLLTGKKVGVIQINNVPGLTLKLLLQKNEVGINDNYQSAVDPDTSKVNLASIGGAQAIGTLGYDYYLAAEPLASAKVKASANSANPLYIAADLQKLYGGENGYPQAVLVVKNDFLEKNGEWVDEFIEDVKEAAAWLQEDTTEISTIVSAVSSKLTSELTPSFNANNLTKTVIANCGVFFTGAQEGKAEVNAFLTELMGVSQGAAKTVADKFFYSK